MPRRKTPLVRDRYYHAYNRGNNRQPIFFRPENYTFFLRQFREYVADEHADVIAYVLMPNHHFVLRTKTDELSTAMQRFGISYAKAINDRFDRVGHLFQGAFQAKPVDEEAYLIHLTRYLHLNPVRAGLVKCAEDWTFSSYLEYIGRRAGTLPHPEIIWQELIGKGEGEEIAQQRYRQFVESYQPKDRDVLSDLLFG